MLLQEGKNVVACLNEAMEAHGLDMRVSALVCLSFLKIGGLKLLSFAYCKLLMFVSLR